MTRPLFKLASAVSMLACVATFCLWVRGQRRSDEIALGPGISLWTCHGSIACWNAQPLPGQIPDRRWHYGSMPAEDALYIRSMLEAEGQWPTKWKGLGVHVWIGQMFASSGSGGLASAGALRAGWV